MQIQELETENSELKQQLQDLEEKLMIDHVPPVRTNHTRTHTLGWSVWTGLFNFKVFSQPLSFLILLQFECTTSTVVEGVAI